MSFFSTILFLQLAEDLGALPIWVFNNGTLQLFWLQIFFKKKGFKDYKVVPFKDIFVSVFSFFNLQYNPQESVIRMKWRLPAFHLFCRYACLCLFASKIVANWLLKLIKLFSYRIIDNTEVSLLCYLWRSGTPIWYFRRAYLIDFLGN